MSERSFYNDVLLDHNLNPMHRHEMPDATCSFDGVNPSCGDSLTLHLRFDGDVISDGSFSGIGCAVSQASADIMLDLIIGRTLEDARRLSALFLKMIRKEATEDEIDELEEAGALRDISHMPARVKCAVLCWKTLDNALNSRK